MKILAAAALALLAPALSACCSSEQARFWQVRDADTGVTAYAVDTSEATLGNVPGERFVDAQGRYADVRRIEVVRQLSHAEYASATGGCDYSVRYCPVLKKCWARPYAR